MVEADIYRHYNSRDYGLRWEHEGFHVWPDGPTPNVVADRAIRSMLSVMKAKEIEATFRVMEWSADGKQRVDSGVRIKARAVAPVIEVTTLQPATEADESQPKDAHDERLSRGG
jgi:hypothetical protein